MNDNDIIKALECCAVEHNCNGCFYNVPESAQCIEKIMRASLDLINRQKAEIEEQDRAIINALKRMGEIRTEAVKEFAERLCDGRVSNDPVVIAVKCIEKEMTEATS